MALRAVTLLTAGGALPAGLIACVGQTKTARQINPPRGSNSVFVPGSLSPPLFAFYVRPSVASVCSSIVAVTAKPRLI
jgi:hypothetical protein